MLTQRDIRRITHYDPETGVFTARACMSGKKAGDILGYNDHGYKRIAIGRQKYYLHHLAFLYMEGRIPQYVDHEDLDGANNVWGNLREATKAQNSYNRPSPVTNSSGVKGASFCNLTKRWRASITVNGRSINLGRYPTREEAGEAYRRAAEKHFGEFARIAA